jgi:hypothetical protein
MDKIDAIIDEIIKNFDFKICSFVLKCLNKEYKENYETDIKELKKKARYVLKSSYNLAKKSSKECVWVGSNFFISKAYYEDFEEEKVCLDLFFSLTDYEFSEWENKITTIDITEKAKNEEFEDCKSNIDFLEI